jgi:creatinine amidohydrolase
MPDDAKPRRYVAAEANYRQLLDYRPNVAILPWGATEAHNFHLPLGTDIFEATAVAEQAAALAHDRGGKPIVLPTIPFGNNAQQLDQVSTIHLSTTAASAVLNDVAASLRRQSIDRLVILNGHGGNEFKPLVRDAQLLHEILIIVVNFWCVSENCIDEIFDDPGEHAGELETSLMLHIQPEMVALDQAGPGVRNLFVVPGFEKTGAWTPRPWSATHPDTGCGDPSQATSEKGRQYLETICEPIADLLIGLSLAEKGQLPYI